MMIQLVTAFLLGSGITLSGSNTKQKLLFKAGDRLPYIKDNHYSQKFYDLFKSPGFHMLHIGDKLLSKSVQEKIRNSLNIPVELVESELYNSWKKLGVSSELFILVRPDNYIGYIQDKFDGSEINRFYITFLIHS